MKKSQTPLINSTAFLSTLIDDDSSYDAWRFSLLLNETDCAIVSFVNPRSAAARKLFQLIRECSESVVKGYRRHVTVVAEEGKIVLGRQTSPCRWKASRFIKRNGWKAKTKQKDKQKPAWSNLLANILTGSWQVESHVAVWFSRHAMKCRKLIISGRARRSGNCQLQNCWIMHEIIQTAKNSFAARETTENGIHCWLIANLWTRARWESASDSKRRRQSRGKRAATCNEIEIKSEALSRRGPEDLNLKCEKPRKNYDIIRADDLTINFQLKHIHQIPTRIQNKAECQHDE